MSRRAALRSSDPRPPGEDVQEHPARENVGIKTSSVAVILTHHITTAQHLPAAYSPLGTSSGLDKASYTPHTFGACELGCFSIRPPENRA